MLLTPLAPLSFLCCVVANYGISQELRELPSEKEYCHSNNPWTAVEYPSFITAGRRWSQGLWVLLASKSGHGSSLGWALWSETKPRLTKVILLSRSQYRAILAKTNSLSETCKYKHIFTHASQTEAQKEYDLRREAWEKNQLLGYKEFAVHREWGSGSFW